MPLRVLVLEMIKATASKSLVLRVNLVFIAFFLIVYAALFLHPSSFYQENAASIVLCSLRDCPMKKVEDGYKMKVVLETQLAEKKVAEQMRPSFVYDVVRGRRIAVVNMGADQWANVENVTEIRYEPVSGNLEWKDLFPEWIDEEEDDDGPSCPEMPMPDFGMYGEMDVIVARLPCRHPEEGWSRDVLRLQIHLIAANLAVKNGRRGGGEKTRVLFLSSCRPMMDMFRCDDLVKQESNWWVYEPDMERLEQKVSLPVGSCKLALPLWERGLNGINEVYNLSTITRVTANNTRREAYATVIHSSEAYVCGAIALAQSIIKTGTTRDLIILLDKSISQPKREALTQAGWKIREIKRIRNPKAEKKSYNEYNYSKFRLWQLTDYDKIIFIDSDIIVLRNLDLLFHFPQMSATGNDGVIFNSGVMVIEPSKCTFKFLMEKRTELVSYNGGDQGYLNEVYVWWHRLPRRVNFLKNFWSNTSLESSMKNQLFGADPPKLYTIHFLGLKPWLCYRDYDCNWNIANQHVYASDVAHGRWWRFHDAMNETLQSFCGLAPRRKVELDWDRKVAEKNGYLDEHWKLKITDPRRHVII